MGGHAHEDAPGLMHIRPDGEIIILRLGIEFADRVWLKAESFGLPLRYFPVFFSAPEAPSARPGVGEPSEFFSLVSIWPVQASR